VLITTTLLAHWRTAGALGELVVGRREIAACAFLVELRFLGAVSASRRREVYSLIEFAS